ncbi:hypothetical protein JCM11641_004771 [Rhodosporidiobolus odoratus]
MKVSSALLTAAATLASAASPQPQIYFNSPHSSLSSSSPSPPSPSPPSSPSLTPPQTNALLAHLLSVSQHVSLPLPAGRKGRQWEQVLQEQVDPEEQKVVVVLECPKYGCQDALPTSLISTLHSYTIPSLSSHSYLSALTLHLHRFAASLGLDAASIENSQGVKGLKELVEEGLKSVQGWQGWVGEEVGSWIGWEDAKSKKGVKAQVEEELPGMGLLGEVDFLDQSAMPLVRELNKLTVLADEISSAAVSSSDSGPQSGGVPQVVVVHLKGLKNLAAVHSPSSPIYQRATSLLSSTLTAFHASLTASTSTSPAGLRLILLALPPHQTPLLRKRTSWMKPFEHAGSQYQTRSSSHAKSLNANVRRSVFSPRQEGGEDDWAKNAPIVPSSNICFKSPEDVKNQTASCLGRGKPVRGLSTKEGECWVCKCGTTQEHEGGKVRRWKGQGCEKEDLSSPFNLLFFSSLGLIALVLFSVGLLAKIGSVPLPGTLGAVGGNGGHAKRD